MHFVKVKGILSPSNGMNLYRGCSHGCIYCDSRSKCYHMEHAFEDIEVKENAIDLLEYALKHKRKKCMIGTGSMTDPYLPLESELGYVRKALSLADRYGFGCSVITKSDRVLRDLDLFERIHRQTKCVVQMTLTTYDENLCQKTEPNVSTTRQRFAALKQLHAAGIPTVVWLSPILPLLNDTEENIRGILAMCIEAKVYGIICFGMGLTLREGNREYFYAQTDRLFAHLHLREQYERLYADQYIVSSPHNRRLMQIFHTTCRKHGIVTDIHQIFHYLNDFEDKTSGTQLSLWDWNLHGEK